MIRKTTLALALTAAAVVGSLAAPAQAASFKLGDLLSAGKDGSITVGDKKFSNFSCNINIIGVGTPGSCNNINVETLDNDPFGLRFQTGFRAGNPGRNAESILTAFLAYDVEVLDPNYVLSATRLGFNGSGGPAASFSNGNLMIQIDQVVKSLDTPSTTVATAEVTNPPIKLTDRQEFNQYLSKARVENTIEMKTKNRATGTISYLDNRFEQTEVPEPGTVGGLLALGSIGVGVMLKKKGKSNDSTSFPPADNNN